MVSYYRLMRALSRTVIYALILAGAAIFAIPFLWMISTSLKDQLDVFAFPPQLIPNPIRWQNYPEALLGQPFGRYTLNTIYVTVVGLVGNVGSCSIVAYGFARLKPRPRYALSGDALQPDDPLLCGDDPALYPLSLSGLDRHLLAADCALFLCRQPDLYLSVAPILQHDPQRDGRIGAH